MQEKQRKTSSLYDFFLTKDVQLRGLSVSLNRISRPSSHRDFSALSKNKVHDTVGLLLNPCNSSSQVLGRKDKSSESNLQNLRTLTVQVCVSNMEWTPSCNQLFLIKDVMSHLEQEEIKFRYQTIRALILKKPGLSPVPSTNNTNSNSSNGNIGNSKSLHGNEFGNADSSKATPSRVPRSSSGQSHAHSHKSKEKIPFNPREVWVFAIRAILVMVKEKNSGGKFRPQLRSGMERLGLRRQYLVLYRKVLDAKLYGSDTGTGPARSTKLDSGSGKSTTSQDSSASDGEHVEDTGPVETGLTRRETLRFAELHTLFQLSDLVLFRATVLQEYRNKGVSDLELKRALTNKKFFSMWSRWFGGGSAARGAATATSTTSAAASTTSDASNDDSSSFTFEVKATLSRLSISVYDNPLEPHHPNSRLHASDTTNLHFSTPGSAPAPRPATVGGMPAAAAADRAAGRPASTLRKPQRRLSSSFATANRATDGTNPRGRSSTPVGNHSAAHAAGHAAAPLEALVVPKQCFSIVLYGIHTGVEWAGDDDKIVNVTLGSVKCFGHKGAELISCGGDPNYWLDYDFLAADVNPLKQPTDVDTSKAVSLALKWCQTAVMSAYELSLLQESRRAHKSRRQRADSSMSAGTASTNDDDISGSESEDSDRDGDEDYAGLNEYRPTREVRISQGLESTIDRYATFDGDKSLSARAMSSMYKNLMRASNKHLVVEVNVSYMHLNWHKKSVLFITDLYYHMVPTSAPGASMTPFQALKAQAAQLSYYRAARGIVDVPAKVSVESTCRGLTIQVPIQPSEINKTVAPRRRSSSRTGLTFTAPRKPFVRPQGDVNVAAHQFTTPSCHYVQLSIGKMSVDAGDYLAGYLTVPRKKAVSPNTAPAEDVAGGTQEPGFQQGEYEFPTAYAEGDPFASSPSTANNSSSNLFQRSESPSPGHRGSRHRPPHRSGSVYESHYVAEGADATLDDTEEVGYIPMTPQEKIRELVLALRNPAVRPLVFCVNDIELCIVGSDAAPAAVTAPEPTNPSSSFSLHKFFMPMNDDGNGPDDKPPAETCTEKPAIKESGPPKRMLTEAPWVVRGVVSPNMVPENCAFTKLRLDLICSPFLLLLSTQVCTDQHCIDA